MRIFLSNRHVGPARDMLRDMQLCGADSRARTRLVTLLEPVVEQVRQDEAQVLQEYLVTADDGALVYDDEGNLTLREGYTSRDVLDAQAAFREERAEITGGTYEGHRQRLIDLLNAWDAPLAGEQADTYDALCTALEEGED